MPVLVQKEWFTEEQILNNPDKIFVFGDNEQRCGRGGQAKFLRGKPNVIGIRTKRLPGTDKNAYWTDDTYENNIRKVLRDFDKVFEELEKGKTLIFPYDGFGTGLAKLSENAPKTLSFINMMKNYCIENWPMPVHQS